MVLDLVRMCLIKNSDVLSVTNVDEGSIYPCSHVPEFVGNLGRFTTAMHDAISGNSCSYNFNYTVVFQEDFGTKDDKTGEFTGCYGSLYRNESDFSLLILDEPIYDYDKVNPYQVLVEHPLTITQAYNKSDTFISVDIFREGLHSFSVQLWLLVFLSILMFSFSFLLTEWIIKTIKIKKNKRKNRFKFQAKMKSLSKYIYNCSLHFLNTCFMDFNHFILNFLSLLLVIFSFIVVNYFCNLMATEMVVVPKPVIHESYSDLIDRNILPLFPRQLNEYLLFKNADDSSDMKILWEKSIEKAGNISGLFFPEKYDASLLEFEKQHHEAVIILNRFWADALKSGLCYLNYFKKSLISIDSKEYKVLSKLYLWDVPDPSAKMITKTGSFRQTIERTPIVLDRMIRMRHIFESHLQHYIINHELGADTALKHLPVKVTFEEISSCKSSTLVKDVPETKAVMVGNLAFLLETCSYLLMASTFALFIEIPMKAWRNNRVIAL